MRGVWGPAVHSGCRHLRLLRLSALLNNGEPERRTLREYPNGDSQKGSGGNFASRPFSCSSPRNQPLVRGFGRRSGLELAYFFSCSKVTGRLIKTVTLALSVGFMEFSTECF